MALLSSPWQSILATPPATRLFALLVVSLTGFNYYLLWQHPITKLTPPTERFVPYLTLVPGLSIYYPWTIISAGFVEQTVIELLVSLLFVTPSLRYFERLWGTFETIKFVLITISVSNLIAFALNWLEALLLADSNFFLYSMNYCGQMALQSGILVAFTQVIPEHQVQFFGSVSIRVKRIPMLYLTFSTIVSILWSQSPFILIQFGWFVAWVYLRFYKRNPEVGLDGSVTYGDRSETFSLVSWFPPVLHYPISLLANSTYSVALRLRLLRPFPTATDLELGGHSAMPGGARAEAERRRALALKALDQRIAASATGPTSPANAAAAASNSQMATPVMPRPPPAAASGSKGDDDANARAGDAAAARREIEGKGKGKGNLNT